MSCGPLSFWDDMNADMENEPGYREAHEAAAQEVFGQNGVDQ